VHPIRSIAVLPLDNFSGDPKQEYFAEGMTDELTTDLATISALRVISRGSVMRFKGENRPPTPEIAKLLNVDAVIEGSVARVGDKVRVTAQLIDAPADRHLWAKSYERDSRDVLALQDQVALAIAREINVELTPREQARLANSRTVDPRAHDAYLKGRYCLSSPTEERVKKALEQFQQAIRLDPNFALPYSGMADAYLLGDDWYFSPTEVMPKAKAAAEKALQLDDTLAEAHFSLGAAKFQYEYDWPGAETEFRARSSSIPVSDLATINTAFSWRFADGSTMPWLNPGSQPNSILCRRLPQLTWRSRLRTRQNTRQRRSSAAGRWHWIRILNASGGVARYGAVADRSRAAVGRVVDTAAAEPSGIARYGAVADRKGALGVEDAAAQGSAKCPCGVSGDGAVADCGDALVVDATAVGRIVGGEVARDDAVADRERASAIDAAADGSGTVADGHVLERCRYAEVNDKHGSGCTAIDGRVAGTLPLDRQVSVNCNVRFGMNGVLDANGIAGACS
jgi:TolB-like protein